MRAREFNVISEIKMSPSALSRMASRIPANAGMEFEMIVPVGDDALVTTHDTSAGNDPPSTIDDIVDFFGSVVDGDQLADQLRKKHREWQHDVVATAWDYAAYRVIGQQLVKQTGQPMSDELTAQVQEIVDNPQSPEHRAAYQIWAAANRSAILDSRTQADWLYSRGVVNMYRASQVFNLPWEHTTVEVNSNSIGSVAKDFGKAIGRDYNWSNFYHGADREPGKYAIEPDGSIQPDQPDRELGMEFVSPTLPVDQILKDLKLVKQWAGQVDAYTNHSTGLHINISLPERDWENLDYVKLVLLSGDSHVAEQFGRYSNHYCSSVKEQLESRVKHHPEKAEKLLGMMKSQLNQAAYKIMHSGETEHTDGINVKDGYIEFRSPGDDWLDSKFDLIGDTVNRYIVALDASMDPNNARDEYHKKLYKLLSPSIEGQDIISLFVDFSADPEKLSQLKQGISAIRNRGRKWSVSNPDSPETERLVRAPDEIGAILAWFKAYWGIDFNNSETAREQARKTRDEYNVKPLD